MNKPNVAIICTNYNYGDYVKDAIISATCQDYDGPLRVYVVDDGSSDHSWEEISSISEPFEKRTLNQPYYSGPIEERRKDDLYAFRINNSGASTGRNVAIWEAWEWADIFGILDSDDAYYSNKVSTLVEKLMQHVEIGVAYGDYDNVHPKYKQHEFKEPYDRSVLLNRCIVHSNSLIKKEVLAKVCQPNKEFFDSRLHGPASKEFIGCTEDYDLWLRLSRICMMTHVPEKLAIANNTGKNQSYKMTAEMFERNAQILRSR
jgi:glycosyltransferase involved in cell wall biosynthesis